MDMYPSVTTPSTLFLSPLDQDHRPITLSLSMFFFSVSPAAPALAAPHCLRHHPPSQPTVIYWSSPSLLLPSPRPRQRPAAFATAVNVNLLELAVPAALGSDGAPPPPSIVAYANILELDTPAASKNKIIIHLLNKKNCVKNLFLYY